MSEETTPVETAQKSPAETPKLTTPKPQPPKKDAPKKDAQKRNNTFVKLTDIDLPEKWNREDPGDLSRLVASIKKRGQLNALVVRQNPDKPNRFILVDGRRRYMALKDIFKSHRSDAAVFVTITDKDNPKDDIIDGLVLNMERLGHNVMDLAKTYHTLIEEFGMSNKAVSDETGASEGQISQYLAILRLPTKIQTAIRKGAVTMTVARELCRLNSEEHTAAFEKLFQLALSGEAPQAIKERVDQYMDNFKRKKAEAKAEAKAKDGKKSKKSKTEEDAPRGRPVVVEDFNNPEILASMDIAGKKKGVAILNYLGSRLSRTKSDTGRKSLKDRIIGAKMVLGLIEFEGDE